MYISHPEINLFSPQYIVAFPLLPHPNPWDIVSEICAPDMAMLCPDHVIRLVMYYSCFPNGILLKQIGPDLICIAAFCYAFRACISLCNHIGSTELFSEIVSSYLYLELHFARTESTGACFKSHHVMMTFQICYEIVYIKMMDSKMVCLLCNIFPM